ncbi:MAG: hypothetical protein WD768_15930 [Phycisphaeraceae bacterium]
MKHIVLFFVLSFATATPALAAEKVFRAGAFAQDITPALGVSLNGGMADRKATAVYDPLHARAIVLDDGTTKLAIVVCDACMIPRDIFDAAKAIASEKTGIPISNMCISATHTHSAPTSTGVFQSDPDETYRKLLTERIALAVEKAHANLEPAKVGWAVGSDPMQVFNRRWLAKEGTLLPDPFGNARDKVKMNPGLGNPSVGQSIGIIDPDVSLLSVQATDGRPIALLANYSLHYVGGQPGDQVSGDYFAQFAKRVGELIEEGQGQRAKGQGTESNPPSAIRNPQSFLAIMSNGTSGDINNVDFSQRIRPARKPGEQIVIVAESVAQAAYKAYTKIAYHDWIPLKVAEKEIELGVRKPTDEDVTQAKQWLEEAKAQGPVLKSLTHIYARETVLLAEYPEKVKAKIQAMRIGELGICAIPCETFVEIGLSIKKHSPLKPTFTISLANGYNGYLPTPRQHELGGYETWRARSSYLEVKASEKIEKTLMELLKVVNE